jgi:hypothetical protein
VAISTEADELRSFLARLHERTSASSSGELLRMLAWAEEKLKRLEGELTTEGISLREQKLFLEVDDLVAPTPEEE